MTPCLYPLPLSSNLSPLTLHKSRSLSLPSTQLLFLPLNFIVFPSLSPSICLCTYPLHCLLLNLFSSHSVSLSSCLFPSLSDSDHISFTVFSPISLPPSPSLCLPVSIPLPLSSYLSPSDSVSRSVKSLTVPISLSFSVASLWFSAFLSISQSLTLSISPSLSSPQPLCLPLRISVFPSISPDFSLLVSLPLNLSIHVSPCRQCPYLSVCQTLGPFVSLSLCVTLSLFGSLTLSLSLPASFVHSISSYLPLSLSLTLTISLSICLPASLLLCLSEYLSASLSIWLYPNLYLSLFSLSVYWPILLSGSPSFSLCLSRPAFSFSIAMISFPNASLFLCLS